MIDTVCIIQSKNMRKIDSVSIGFILIINVSFLFRFFLQRIHSFKFVHQIILTASKPHVITKRNGYKGLNELATDFLEIQIRETESYDHILRALSATKLKLTSPSVSVSDVNNIVRMIDVFQRFSNYRQSIQSDLVNLARRVDQMKDEDEVTKLFNRIVKRMKCLKSITSCLNLDVIAKRLSSPTVCSRYF